MTDLGRWQRTKRSPYIDMKNKNVFLKKMVKIGALCISDVTRLLIL